MIASLNLEPDDLEALRHGGTISAEPRGTLMRYRLRWWRDGRQRSLYIGSDATRAALIRQALHEHQRLHRLEQRIAVHAKQASLLLRTISQRLAPVVHQAGLRFHGRCLRRPRSGHPLTEMIQCNET